METLSWEILYQNLNNNQQPEGRYKHEVAFYKEKIYILGGGNSIDTFDLANIPIFDLNTNQWEIVTSSPDPAFPDRGYPKPRKFFSAIQTSVEENEYMFVIGGSNGSHPWKDVWRLNLSCLKWKKMEKTFLPKPLFFHSSCVTPAGCAYIFGGSRLKRYETIRTNRLYKVWLRIPKLSEICWEAIVYYVPTLKMINKLDLLALGIPSEFINRLDEN